MEKLRIAVISKSDERGGGASVVAKNLVYQYNELGYQADHIHHGETGPLNVYGKNRKIITKIKHIEGHFGYRDHNPWELYLGNVKQLADRYDYFHLHDMSHVYSHTTIEWLARKKPLLWTIHDCSPFTAGCLYPSGCEKFHNICQQCPQTYSWPIQSRYDRTSTIHARRRQVLEKNIIHFTAPSRWMVGEFLKGGYSKETISYIPNGVNTKIFTHRDVNELRRSYGLENHKGIVVLFSAGWLHDSRKGPHYAAEIAHQLADLNPKLILVGRYSNEAKEIFQGLDIIHAGFVRSDEERAKLYALADISLMLSSQENAPLTVLECLASGTPVFGFNVGGVIDMVVSNLEGGVADIDDVRGLQGKIRRYWQASEHVNRLQLAQVSQKKYEYRHVAETYIALMKSRSAPRREQLSP